MGVLFLRNSVFGAADGEGAGLGKIWTPDITSIQVNDNPAIATGTFTVYAAAIVGGEDALHFEIQFVQVPSTGIVESSLFFDFSFPTDIDVADFYGDVKYSYIAQSPTVNIFGCQSGGSVGATSMSVTAPYTHARVQTYFAEGEETAYLKAGAVRGIFIR